jgi:Flagellar C1a complex subunit C1a-32
MRLIHVCKQHACSCLQDLATDDAVSGVKASFERFKELVLKYSVERPPWSIGIFTLEVRYHKMIILQALQFCELSAVHTVQCCARPECVA